MASVASLANGDRVAGGKGPLKRSVERPRGDERSDKGQHGTDRTDCGRDDTGDQENANRDFDAAKAILESVCIMVLVPLPLGRYQLALKQRHDRVVGDKRHDAARLVRGEPHGADP